MRKEWTGREVEQLNNLVELGKSIKEIATIMDRTSHSIGRKMQKLNLKSKYNRKGINSKWNKEMEDLTIKLFNSGYSYDEISTHKDINLSKDSVRNKLQELGLVKKGDKYSKVNNYDYLYSINDIVNGLKIVKQTRRDKYNDKSYIVQSIEHPKAPTYMVTEMYLKHGGSCAYVTGKRIYEGNSLYSLKYIRDNIIDVERAKNIAPHSSKKELFKCENNCGVTKKMTPNSLLDRGFSCPNCSKNITYPERFIIEYLKIKNIPYKHQYKFSNSKRRIDFKVWINSIPYLLECHGIQHYKEQNSSVWKNAYSHTKKSDEVKRKFAKDNKIVLIELDCRYSDFNFIKEQVDNNIYLPSIVEEEVNSICENIMRNSKYDVKSIIKDYNRGMTLKKVADKHSTGVTVVKNVLKQNNVKIRTNGESRTKLVKCIKTGDVYSSVKEISELFNIPPNVLYRHLNGERKTAGEHPITGEKLTWEYVEEE